MSEIQKRKDGHIIRFDSATSKRMRGIRRHDTGPELVVRSLLHQLGHRFRVHNRDLPGSPDVANRRRRWAIFVHGCYWHRHPACPASTTPKRNREFWLGKCHRNVERDAARCAEVVAAGYAVLIVWECETKGDTSTLCTRLEEYFEGVGTR